MVIEKELILKSKHTSLNIVGNIVYFLLKGDEIVYIGSTHNLNFRLEYHLRTKDFDSFYYVQTKDDKTMLQVEAENIINYCPKYNKIFNEQFITISYLKTYLKKIGYESNKKEIRKVIEKLSIKTYPFNNLNYIKKEDVKNIIYTLIGEKNVLSIK